MSQVVVDALRVDEPAVAEDDAQLFLLEGDPLLCFRQNKADRVKRMAVAQRSRGHHFSHDDSLLQRRLFEIGGEDLWHGVLGSLAVVDLWTALGLQLDHRLVGTHAHAAYRADHSRQPAFVQLSLDSTQRFLGAGRQPARSRPDGDP